MALDNEGGNKAAPPDFEIAKDLLFLVPLLGTALAITYDVGYFSGINLYFFSFFSLTEHIGFALQAFPFALITASVLGLLFIYIRPVTGANKANRHKQSKIGLLIWVAWAVFACAFLLIFKTYAVAIGGLIGGMLIGFVVLVSNLIARVLLCCLAATVLTFAIGLVRRLTTYIQAWLQNI
jgi:hypothetical protein